MISQSIKGFLLCLFIPMLSWAQPEFNYQQIKSANPDKDYYMLSKGQHVMIDEAKGKLKIEVNEFSNILYLTERGTRAAEKVISHYTTFSKVDDVNAKTWVPVQGGKFKAVPVEKFTTRKPTKDGIFYDDAEEKHFIYPSLVEGAVASLDYNEEMFDPHLLGTYIFQSGIPVGDSYFKVSFPDNVKVRYKILGDAGNSVKFTEEKKKGKTTYTFRATNLKEIEFEDGAPDLLYYSPHVIVFIESYEFNGKKTDVLPDLNGLFRWYSELVEKVKNDASEELKVLADSIRKVSATPEEQLKQAVYWQQDNIKYIAFEDGLGGFIPRNPADVLRKRYGDCKDKAYLLTLLLNELGFEAYPAWIGTRDIPYSYNEVPSPAVDNHMIAAVRWKNEWVFLDGTSYFIPLGMPTSMIQGKEAMIKLNADSFIIVKVPEIQKEKNVRADSFVMKLNGKNLEGKGVRTFSGYFQESTQIVLNFQSQSKRDEYMLKGLKIASNKYNAQNMQYSGYGQRDSLLSLSYDVTVNDYAEEIDGKLYVNMNLVRAMPFDKMDWKKRKVGISVDHKYISRYRMELKIPAGYTVEALPSNVSFSNEKYGLDSKYEVKGDVVVLSHAFWIDTLMLPVGEMPEWSNYFEKLLATYKSLVIFKKK